MPVSRRYSPEWAAGDSGMVGMDFSNIIPRGVGIAGGVLVIVTNSVSSVVASEFTISPCQVEGRVIYAMISGGNSGTDYRLVWRVDDTDGNHWGRSALMLCSPTS